MKNSPIAYRILIAGGALLAASPVQAATVVLNVSADTYLYSEAPTTAQNNDTDNEIIVGTNTQAAGGQFHGLVRFDTSSITVPVNFTVEVTGVTLNTLNRNSAGAGTLTIQVYDYGFNFVESLATWNNPDGADGGDATAGGTTGTLLTSLASVNTAADATNTFPTSVAFAAAVQSAILGDDTVNLLLKRNTIADSNNFTRFLSNRVGGVGFQLDIDYNLVAIPEPSAALLGGLGTLLLLRRRR